MMTPEEIERTVRENIGKAVRVDRNPGGDLHPEP
jgi:hypothetical protein